uniref:Uncharacterized protein n=1 Tax=viral metagenome TaxID=1070528 RepID=A0A6C0HVE3_9ZZZZ
MNLELFLIIFYYIIMVIYLFQKYTKYYLYSDLSDLLDINFITILTSLFIKSYLIVKAFQLLLFFTKLIHKIIE